MLFVFSKAKVQRIMSASLAVWLSGFVLLFCCGTMEATAAETEFCPLAKAQKHCNKPKVDENQPTFSGESDSTFDCCNFLPAVFDKVRKLEKIQQAAQIVAQIKIERPQIFSIKKDFEISEIYRPPILTNQKIFIKNCVFRI